MVFGSFLLLDGMSSRDEDCQLSSHVCFVCGFRLKDGGLGWLISVLFLVAMVHVFFSVNESFILTYQRAHSS